jgi:polar amino acid transport system substrate-binding protein
LCGYDVAYAYQLAKDLDVKLELVPIQYDKLAEAVNTGYCDIVMSAIVMDEQRIINMQFSKPLQSSNRMPLVLRITDIDKYRTPAEVNNDPNFRLGNRRAYKQGG